MTTTRQFISVLKIARPRHLAYFLKSPKYVLRKFRYHYRRVPEKAFIEFLAKKLNASFKDVYLIYLDHIKNNKFWEKIRDELNLYPNSYALQMTKELSTLYLTVRLHEPDYIIETGVSSGASSTYILQALYDNGKGRLCSIDLPPDNLPEGKMSGWLVPLHLRDRWSLHVGDSRELLEPLLESIGQIDCFLHDSLHTYDHMMWEFQTVWNYLRHGGLFLSHDVGANDAFLDFMMQKRISWKDYRVFHVLGAFLKE
jgi:predicted O-methyltransferase YrrM